MRGCRGRDSADPDGAHPLTRLILADRLIVDKPYADQGSFLEIELAAGPGDDHWTYGGRALNDDVRDTVFAVPAAAGTGQ